MNRIAEKCPNLRAWRMDYVKVTFWPRGPILENLRELTIMGEASTHRNTFNNGGLVGLELYNLLPQLEVFNFIVSLKNTWGPVWLPDLTGCKKLQKVALGANSYKITYRVPEYLEDSGPFPNSLKVLDLQSSIINWSNERLLFFMRHSECRVELRGPWVSRLGIGVIGPFTRARREGGLFKEFNRGYNLDNGY